MKLPDPRIDGSISVEKAIKDRRTVRWFSGKEIRAQQLSQILWAAQGITDDAGFKRAAPSAGALYPMDLYTVVGTGCVEGFSQGLYHYEPRSHVLSLALGGDHRDELARASLSQTWMAKAPVNIVICAEYERITPKYGSRGERYAMIEAGHIAQNIFLQAQALELEAGIVGAFNDDDVIRVMRIKPTHRPLLIMPIGYR
ncbi:MAG: SagB/ThcOx family dehydrogenase [Desulfomonilia bacterium]